MNNDKVLELAKKAGFYIDPDDNSIWDSSTDFNVYMEDISQKLTAFAQALNEHRGEPLLYVRMRDGEVDWSEDCVSPDTSCGDSYELEEGYTAVPLYAAPVTPVGDEREDDDLSHIAGMLDGYIELIKEDGNLERWHYIPEVEDYRERLLAKHPIPAIPEPDCQNPPIDTNV